MAFGIWSGILLADRTLIALPALILLALSMRRLLLGPILLLATVGAATLAIHDASLARNEIQSLIQKVVEIEGVVSTDPSRTRARVIGSRAINSRATFILRAESVREVAGPATALRVRIPVRAVTSNLLPLIPGERIQLQGTLVSSEERKVAALVIVNPESLQSLAKPRFLVWLERIRSELRDKSADVGGDSAGLIPGMVIGDTSLQSEAFANLMLEAGLSHLTAVSGANFAIVSGFVFTLIGFILPRRKPQVAVTIIVLSIFVLLVRPTPSVLRASLMALVFMLAKVSGREKIGANALAWAVALLLLINPYQAFESGFILSVLATAGLIFAAPKVAQFLPGPKFIGELISIPLTATLYCAPYLLYLSGGLNLGSILMNIAVAPVVPLITVLGFVAMLLVIPVPFISQLLIAMANVGAKWIVFVASWSDSMPALLTSPVVILLLLATFLLSRFFSKQRVTVAMISILLLLSAQRIYFANTDWIIGQCDVGQGDALLVNLGKGAAILLDAGPDPKLLDRCLDIFEVQYLPLVVITHAHADHYFGLPGLKNRKIGQLWTNSGLIEEPSLGFSEALAVEAGMKAQVGSASVKVLWPMTGAANFESIAGDGSIENNRSLVTLIEIAGVKLLVTGDIEPGAQSTVLERWQEELHDVGVIKVPHHGSKYQDSRLFGSAAIFLISVGVNSYGHPDPDLVGQLEERGRIFRTDRDGQVALAWQIGRSEPIFSARTLGKEWWRISWQ